MTQSRLSDLLHYVSDQTVRPASAGARTALAASESDKGRIVNSASFRRLQQKAQVFPLDPNAAVRTRLTHSIEVSQLGRYLAQKVINKLGHSTAPYPDLAALVNVVENACLLHDIGNPPFGHLGEAALQQWFRAEGSDSDPKWSDLKWFDGNPQGFRVISRLAGRDDHGLNVTCSLLLSTVKYPWSVAGKPEDAKIGVFDMDWPTYQEACRKLGWTEGKKFPFVLLMEAADDIAYAMSDLEDGVEKHIVSVEELEGEFGKERFQSQSVDRFVAFKTGVINEAIEVAAETFTQSLVGVLAGDRIRLLPVDSAVGVLLGKVKTFARARIYSHPSAEKVELAGRSVLTGLLTHFKPLLDLEANQFTALLAGDPKSQREFAFQGRLLRLLPEKYKAKYLSPEGAPEVDRRAHLIVDFVAGMTDHYALETYQLLEGIRIQ